MNRETAPEETGNERRCPRNGRKPEKKVNEFLIVFKNAARLNKIDYKRASRTWKENLKSWPLIFMKVGKMKLLATPCFRFCN